MNPADVQPVLRCEQCNKPFDKQSTLKRHGYYCRSRGRRAPTSTRPRSCISCARGKSACDKRRPKCSRCISKTIECHYPSTTSRSKGFETRHTDDEPIGCRGTILSSVQESPHVTKNPQEPSTDGEMILDAAIGLPALDFPNIEGEYLGWDEAGFTIADFLNNMQTSGPYLSPESPSFLSRSTPSTGSTFHMAQGLSSPNSSIPPTPSLTVRLLVQRPKRQAGAQRIANLIFHALKSYPMMMLRHNTLPPFIHSNLVSFNDEDIHVEPLTNCISLVHMISSGIQGSRSLFWKNVRLECERFYEEHDKLNKWELLTAMQALSIYVLIRLDEGETDHNNFDFLLVKTVAVIAQQISRDDITSHTQCALCNRGLELSWKEWIFKESRRRLGLIYRVVSMLIYFEPIDLCSMPQDLVLAPLPSKRNLWEAGDELKWRTEGQGDPGIKVSFGLATDGNITRLNEDELSCTDAWLNHPCSDSTRPLRRPSSWEEWCSGMDVLGGLVMLAGALIV